MSRVNCLVAIALTLAACSEAPTAPAGRVIEGAPGPAFAVSASSLPVVMSGLDSPRGLAWGPEGALYVVEAGDLQVRGACVPVARGPNCYSGSGAVSRLWHGLQERVASGLPSITNTTANDITGPHDIGFIGQGTAFITVGWGGDPTARAGLGASGDALGHMIQLAPGEVWKAVADISGFESAQNPDGGFVDSNPYGLLVEPARRFVTDAGGNSLVEVDANGRVSLVATFPKTPAPPPFLQAEAVPTEVQRGPDGALYVSTLSGVPFLAGAAAIYRVVPGQAPTLVAGGFKTITDFAFAPDGSLYVLEFAGGPVFFGGPGQLVHVALNGTRTAVVQDLIAPTGVLVGPDGSVYISNKGNLPAVGEVLRYDP